MDPLGFDSILESTPREGPWGWESELTIRPGQTTPEQGGEIKLSDAELKDLEEELCDEIDNYVAKSRERHLRWDEIEDAYDLVPSSAAQVPEGEPLVSEIMMSHVDQAAARMQNALSGANPLIHVSPIQGEREERALWANYAKQSSQLLNNYCKKGSSLSNLLPVICHRTAKLGTSVVLAEWRTRKHQSRWHEEDGSTRVKDEEVGYVHYELVENRDMVVWPSRVYDWQEAEIVGHFSEYLSRSSWERKADELGIDEETRHRIENTSAARTDGAEGGSLSETFEPVTLGRFYCCRHLPGYGIVRFIVWLHHESRTICRIAHNDSAEQRHPYHPVRWKLTDRGAWGDGVGDELIGLFVQASALDNLEAANLLAGAFYALRIDPGSMADRELDRMLPGEKIRAAAGEIETMKMGGDAPEVPAAKDRVYYRAREADGLASVLAGMGDPVQKSGTGTGATLALIEQAGEKFKVVGDRIQLDLGELFSYTLELLFHYAPEGTLYTTVGQGNPEVVRTIRFLPPRRRPSEILHVRVEAPSAAGSQEARKMHYLAIYNFLEAATTYLDQNMGQVIMQESPPTYMRWKREWATLTLELMRRIIDVHDLPKLSSMIPDLPQPTPEETVITQLQQQIGELQAQIQSMQAVQMQMQNPMTPPPQQVAS